MTWFAIIEHVLAIIGAALIVPAIGIMWCLVTYKKQFKALK